MAKSIMAHLFVLSTLILSTLSFPIWMKDFICDQKLEVDEIITGSKVIESEERHIRLWRGENEIFSGDVYSPLEYLRVRISKSGMAHLFEAKGGAKFVNGTCHGTRIASAYEALLFLPDHDNDISDVTITAGWENKIGQIYLTPKFILVQKEESRNGYETKEHVPSYLERIVKNRLDSFSSNAEASAMFLSEVRNRLTSRKEVEDQIHLSDPDSGEAPHPSRVPGSNRAKKAKRPANHRRARPVGPIVDIEASGEHADVRGSKRAVLSKTDRAREMQKIRDSGLFGVHGQGQGRRVKGKNRDEVSHGGASVLDKVGGALTLLCSTMQREHPLLFVCGKILLCVFLLCALSRLYSNRYRIYRYFGKKRGLL